MDFTEIGTGAQVQKESVFAILAQDAVRFLICFAFAVGQIAGPDLPDNSSKVSI